MNARQIGKTAPCTRDDAVQRLQRTAYRPAKLFPDFMHCAPVVGR